VSSDPDALWKPGFAGEVVYPTRDPVPAPRLSRSLRHHRVLVGATIVVAALVAVTAIAITRLGGDPAQAAAPRLPLHGTERWSVTMPGQVWHITASDDVVLAAAHGSDARITALRADTGAELWSRSGDRARLAAVGIMGDTALFLTSPSRGDDDLVGVDLHSGVERWRQPMPTKGSMVQVAGHHVLVTRVAVDDPSGSSASTSSPLPTAPSGPPSTVPTSPCANTTSRCATATRSISTTSSRWRRRRTSRSPSSATTGPPSCGSVTPPWC